MRHMVVPHEVSFVNKSSDWLQFVVIYGATGVLFG
jgi:hypothetical protein